MNCSYCDEPLPFGDESGACKDCAAEMELEEAIYEEEYHESLKVEYDRTE